MATKKAKPKPTPITRAQLQAVVNGALASGSFVSALKKDPGKVLKKIGVKAPSPALVKQIKKISLRPFKPVGGKDPAC